jgi:hypothetical protein
MLDRPGKLEHYEKRFGIIAIEKGFITPENLVEAFKIQIKEDVDLQTHRLIGEILLDSGYMTTIEIQEVLDAVFKQ